jgi:hypothetical protein
MVVFLAMANGEARFYRSEGLRGFAEHLFAGEACVAEQPSVLGEFAQRSSFGATDDPDGDGAEVSA